jgi:hypothetical protein
MKRPSVFVLGVAVLAAGVGTVAYRSLVGPRGRTAIGEPGAVPALDQAELASLRREVALLRAQVVLGPHLPAGPPSGSNDPPPSARRRPARDPEALAEGLRRRRALIEGLESAFLGEATDPSWSVATSAAVRAALAADEVGLPARGVDCRSRTCRVEIPDDGSGRVAETLALFANELAATLPNMVAHQMVDASGTATTFLYLTRTPP